MKPCIIVGIDSLFNHNILKEDKTMLISDFSGELEFLKLDYACPINYSGCTFSSLYHALIAMRCDDMRIWKIIMGDEAYDKSSCQALYPEILSKKIDDDVYLDRVIELVLCKYRDNNLREKLTMYCDPYSSFDYPEDPSNGYVSTITRLIIQKGENSLAISEAIRGETQLTI